MHRWLPFVFHRDAFSCSRLEEAPFIFRPGGFQRDLIVLRLGITIFLFIIKLSFFHKCVCVGKGVVGVELGGGGSKTQ